MKKFFNEFKVFITRGNVLDMAVGIIIGGAFTAIVTALTQQILTPLINSLVYLIFGGGDALAIYTILVPHEVEGVVDLATSIYIDWGAFISAIINFILIALVLFILVRTINRVKENNEQFLNKVKAEVPTKQERKEMKALGLNYRDKDEVIKYKKQKEEEAQQKLEEEKKAEEEKAKLERLANPTTEDLLKDIKALLQNQLK